MSLPLAHGYLITRSLYLLPLATQLATAQVSSPVTSTQPPGARALVTDTPSYDRFPLAVGGRLAPILVSHGDHPGVVRAARDLRADLERVTGTAPVLSTTRLPTARSIVLVGTLGTSPLIDSLVRMGRIDASGVAGRWEASLTQVVAAPFPGVDRALVIAGSDPRGTIYGIYGLSAQIGVSPWYWWADVPVRRRTSLHVLPGRHLSGEPAVKYRGIFINDEAPALSGWARETFGGFNSRFYAKVFELLLRLRGNYLWPAMWGSAFAVDDTLSPRLAEEYGIVMGTSHHEPMTRAHAEWQRFGKGPWNYRENDSTLRAFWRDGIRRLGTREHIVTLGMRGDGDMPMSREADVALLERIVADQRKIIDEVTKKPAAATPQLWALYKEVQEYYDKGMRVPDDVTLLFADDNWGNIRRLPALADSARPGGFGVYYHFDYVGGPRSYKWINTNQIERTWEQMHLAWRYGADRIWIVNVGDIKPMELPTQFFLDFAWNPDAWPAERLPDYLREWARQQFGPRHAAEIAAILASYTRFNARRKPELLSPETYSLSHYREAERVVAEFNALVARAERVQRALPPAVHDAYYQLVLHPVQASATLNELHVTVAKNRLYAQQGRAATNDLAERARALFEKDAAISRYYNTQLAGGKWRHMMDQTHIGYTHWQEPPRNVMPRVDVIQVPAAAEMGVWVEGAEPPRTASPPAPDAARVPVLPEFDRFNRQTHFVEIYNRGRTPFAFTAQAGAPWLVVRPASGKVEKETRVEVSVDWRRAPAGVHRVPITVSGPGTRRIVVQALVRNPVSPAPEAIAGFVEGNGYVSIEAEHYSRAVAPAPIWWQRIPGIGRTLSGMSPFPVAARSQTPGGDAPRLEYDVYLFDSTNVAVSAYLSPTLNFPGRSEGLRYAISFDDEPPQIVNVAADTSQAAWSRKVADNIAVHVTRHRLARPGAHVLKFWMVDPGVVLQKLVIDAGGLRPSYFGPPESHRAREPAAAAFDWFAYEGNDTVYTTVRPSPDEYLNPILAGFYPDPSIVGVGGDYYLVNSSFAYFPGVPIFHSRDLVNWTPLGHVLDRPSQLRLDGVRISEGIFAPTIEYHRGTYYMVTTLVGGGGNFYVTASNPAGPWSDPVWLPEIDGIDPSFFFDDDGRAYIVNNGPPPGPPRYEGHRALWMQEFDLGTKQLTGPRRVIVDGGVDITKKPIWIEGPHILKIGRTYYLIAAEGGTAEEHSQVVFRGESVWGPWVPYAHNPILTQRHLDPGRPFPITSTGHADFVRTPAGEWWSVFLGVRPYMGNHYNIGRETYLMPVRWIDGWPVILSGDETVPFVHARPALPRQPAPPVPTSGNFTHRDEFDATTLPSHWLLMRTPREPWLDLRTAPGSLTLRSRNVRLDERAQPSFVGRRQQHTVATATTAMRYAPERDGDKAGIVAFHNEDHWYFFGVARSGGRTVLQVEQRARRGAESAETRVLASVPVQLSGGRPIHLRIEARGARYDFAYAHAPGEWVSLLRGADGTILSSKVAGGFVGTLLGLHAYTSMR